MSKKTLLLSLCCTLLLLTACIRETLQDEPFSPTPVSDHSLCLDEYVEDFKIKVSSLQEAYDRPLLDKEVPLQGSVQIQYCGSLSEVSIIHSQPAYSLALCKESDIIMALNVCLDSGYVTTLSTGNIYEDIWWSNGAAVWQGDSDQPLISSLPAGEYTIRIEVSFHYVLNENADYQDFNHVMEIPITLY